MVMLLAELSDGAKDCIAIAAMIPMFLFFGWIIGLFKRN